MNLVKIRVRGKSCYKKEKHIFSQENTVEAPWWRWFWWWQRIRWHFWKVKRLLATLDEIHGILKKIRNTKSSLSAFTLLSNDTKNQRIELTFHDIHSNMESSINNILPLYVFPMYLRWRLMAFCLKKKFISRSVES